MRETAAEEDDCAVIDVLFVATSKHWRIFYPTAPQHLARGGLRGATIPSLVL